MSEHKAKCVVIPADSHAKAYIELLDAEGCKRIINGWMEPIHFADGLVMIVDEEATFKDPLPPQNPNATKLADVLLHRTGRVMFRDGPHLLGNAVLVQVNVEGDWVDIAASQLLTVMRLLQMQEQ